MSLPFARSVVLLLTSTVLLALLGGCARHAKAERHIYSHGGEIVPDYSHVGFDDVDLSDDDIAKLSWALREIRPWHLSLHGTSITDLSLYELAKIKGMRGLFMGGTQITPSGLERLLRSAPDTLHQVGVPAEWLDDPARDAEVKAIEQRNPRFDISFWYRDANGWHWIDRSGRTSGSRPVD